MSALTAALENAPMPLTGQGSKAISGIPSALATELGGNTVDFLNGMYRYSIPGLLDRIKNGVTGSPDTTGADLAKFAQASKIVGGERAPKSFEGQTGKFLTEMGIAAPRFVLTTVATGGNPIIGMALESSLRSAGRGEDALQQTIEGGKGAVFGAMFGGGSLLKNAVEKGLTEQLASKTWADATKELIAKSGGEAAKIASLGAGGALVATAEGADPKRTLKQGDLLILQDVMFNYAKVGKAADLAGKVIRVPNGEKPMDVLFAENNGKVDAYDVTGKVPGEALPSRRSAKDRSKTQ